MVGLAASPHADAAGLRFLLYSHDGVGFGRVHRNLIIAAALMAARPDTSVLVVTSAEDMDAFTIPAGVDLLRVPGLRKLDNAHYSARRLAVSPRELHELRAGVLAGAVEGFRPHVLLADKYPGGVQDELVPALELQYLAGRRAALGLRDVLDDPACAHREWVTSGSSGHVEDFHDLVLVYGQPDLLDPLAACGLEIRRLACFCGYIVAEHAPATTTRRQRRRPFVVATGGGGEDAGPLLRAFLRAAAGAPWDALAVCGPLAAPAERKMLDELAAGAGARVVRSVRDLGLCLATSDAVVCMGGYNTLNEVLASGTPAVCVPRVVPRAEQLVRARAFAARGLLRLIEPDDLTISRLRLEVDAALATDRRSLGQAIRATMDFGGARRAAAMLLALAATAVPAGTATRGS